MIERPNLFIVGAPKSGTTSLHEYLNMHPRVGMSTVKEPCYFASDFESPKYPDSEKKYLSLFECDSNFLYLGEGSTTYLYSLKAAEEIAGYNPDAKIIMMLRQPADLVVSLHAQRLKEGDETIKDCEEAINAESMRSIGYGVPSGFQYPKEYLLYSEVPRYAKQIQRYLSNFPRESIHVILFEKFKENPRLEFSKVCKFLGVDDNVVLDFEHHNAGRVPKNIKLHRVLKKVVPYIIKIECVMNRILPEFMYVKLQSLFRFGYGLNMSNGVKKVRADFLNALDVKYEKDISDLRLFVGSEVAQDIERYWR